MSNFLGSLHRPQCDILKKKASEICFSEVFAMIPVALLLEWERAVTHARCGCDGCQV